MSVYTFKPLAHDIANEAWRPLDRALYRWVTVHGGSPLLAQTAAWASVADGEGDTAVSLGGAGTARHEMPVLTPEQVAQLRAQPMVSDGQGGVLTPFVLDADGRFYLWRNHQHERAAVSLIRQRRARRQTQPVDEADIDALFHGQRNLEEEPQRCAVRQVAGHRLFVLTGGPGTGKTTTVLRMLLLLQRQASRPLAIQVAAPTGKAAQRLVQSLRKGKHELMHHASAPLPASWREALDSIPDRDALTLHRLLGYQPYRNAFKRDASDPIAADVVVVDEASMVDLAMLRGLLEAVRLDATLILVGDADQLTSVAAGSVLMDLVALLESEATDDIVRLRHSFRAQQYLVRINEAVRAGDAAELNAAMAAAGHAAAHRHINDTRQLAATLRSWARQLAANDALRPTLPPHGWALDHATNAAVDTGRDDIGPADASLDDASANAAACTALVLQALDALGERQLLCALRETDFGALASNALIEHYLRGAWKVGDGSSWYSGRAVIITRNDYAAGLFNGDVGLCLADCNGAMRVWFEVAQDRYRIQTMSSGGDAPTAVLRAVRSFSPSALPAHETAFAITIHKSQGSEYGHVAVLLPPDADNRILSRQLLYTGLSRAKKSVEVWSAGASLEVALAQPVQRIGGLADRLGDAYPA
jgi:exodeoxyribonuclease V alpha subunit